VLIFSFGFPSGKGTQSAITAIIIIIALYSKLSAEKVMPK
jgi:hypothetical protein